MGGKRIEGTGVDDAGRERIARAAKAAGTSVGRFVGQAALAAASGEGYQVARLEHITEVQEKLAGVQEKLAAQLAALRDGQVSVSRTGAELLAHHEETHRRLDDAIARLAGAQAQIADTLEAQLRTHAHLAALLEPTGYLCEQVARLARHLGLDPGEPPPGCGDAAKAIPRGGTRRRDGVTGH